MLIDPLSTNGSITGASRITVSVADVVDAAGFAFILKFDPGVIRIEQLEPGSFAAGCSIQVKDIDTEDGRVDFACITVPLTGVSGSGVFAEVSLVCMQSGSADLELEQVEITDSLAQPIAVKVESGRVTCQEDGT